MQDAGALITELDQWTKQGRTLAVWWRDDDVTRPTAALDRLASAARRHQAPLALAAIPAALDEGLAPALDDPLFTVLQHGFSHRNHGEPGGRAVECGGDRPLAEIAASLSDGAERLDALFGARFLKIIVPPWNRIDPAVASLLPGLGYGGLSVFGERDAAQDAARALPQINAHLDLLTWKGGARFAGHDKLVKLAAERIALRRIGETGEAFGILTHHLDHDAATWAFLDELLALFAAHPAVRLVATGDLLR